MKTHRCGGELQPQILTVRKRTGSYFQNFKVPGYVCNKCGDKVITRDLAVDLELVASHLGRIWKDWNFPPIGRTLRTQESQYNSTSGTFETESYSVDYEVELLNNV